DSRRGVQRDREPDLLEIAFRDAVASQKVARRIRAVHLEAQPTFPEVEGQPLPLPGQGAPEIDARGVLKQQVALDVANELRCFARQLAVGNLHTGNLVDHHGPSSTSISKARTHAFQGRGDRHYRWFLNCR